MTQRIPARQIVETFLSYTAINTTAVASNTQLPSCENQLQLARLVVSQLAGLDGISTDISANAITTIALAATDPQLPSIAFFAHLDTAPDHTGDTHPQMVKAYDGTAIPLPGTGETFSPEEFPELRRYIGQDIITTDGTSLLGADDKAAIAAGVEAVRYMATTPTFRHGEIKLVLLPDEEIGIRGAKALDVAGLNADFGICLDCCGIGEYVVENWYAGSARVTFHGATAHPMSAKGKLVNALLLAGEFMQALPVLERPEHTEGREGYFWVHKLSGDTAEATLDIAIRDFEHQGYLARKQQLLTIADTLRATCGSERVKITLQDVYDNVKPSLDKNPQILTAVEKAMHNLGITPAPLIMRGGYDGSVITPKGLPTVNIFTGAHNFHSTREFLPVESLRMASEMLLEIVKLSGEGNHA